MQEISVKSNESFDRRKQNRNEQKVLMTKHPSKQVIYYVQTETM